LASTTIERVTEALTKGFRAKGAKVEVWANKSDYKDFIRMYVVSDYFKGMSDKERADAVYSALESSAAKESIKKISLCIGMTKREKDEEFGEGAWLGPSERVYRGMKPRPRLRRLASSSGRR
jgi:stress-induced morphogen